MSLRSCLAVALGLTLGFTIFTLTLIVSVQWSSHTQFATPTIAVSEPDLSGQVRVLCMVMTYSSKHKTRTVAVRDTWGRHCNTLLFMSDTYDPSIPTVDTKVKSNLAGNWKMTAFGLQHVFHNYKDHFDWVFKCDDDTYAIIENMREYLIDFSPQNKSYMGFQLKHPVRYMSGGAGYILSKETVKYYLDHCMDSNHKSDCSPDIGEMEDLVMGRCMKSLGIEFVDTRDAKGRNRFFTDPVSSHVFPYNNLKTQPYVWYLNSAYFPSSFGQEAVPEAPISFHHLSDRQMYSLEYLIYQIKKPQAQIMIQPTELTTTS